MTAIVRMQCIILYYKVYNFLTVAEAVYKNKIGNKGKIITAI